MSERFLEQHRNPTHGYDLIQFPEHEIEALRSRLELQTSLRVSWSWQYTSEIESLRALYEKGTNHQWSVERDLDWSIPVSDDEWVVNPRKTLIGPILKMMGRPELECKRAVKDELEYGISQLLHGEQAALLLTAQVANSAIDYDAKLFAGQQVADECRHVEVFSKLLARKFGSVHPVDPVTKFLLDEMIESTHWYRKVVGMQILFEGVAMAVLTDIGSNALNPLVKMVMRRVTQDEARHAAFGVLALSELLGELAQTERDDLELWTWKLVEVVSSGLMAGTVKHLSARYGLNERNVQSMVFATPEFWDGRYNLLNHTVLPNLKRLGLITDLTRKNYEAFYLLGETAPHGSKPIPQSVD